MGDTSKTCTLCAKCQKTIPLTKSCEEPFRRCGSCEEYVCPHCELSTCAFCKKSVCDRPSEYGGASDDECVICPCNVCGRNCCDDCENWCTRCEDIHCTFCLVHGKCPRRSTPKIKRETTSTANKKPKTVVMPPKRVKKPQETTLERSTAMGSKALSLTRRKQRGACQDHKARKKQTNPATEEKVANELDAEWTDEDDVPPPSDYSPASPSYSPCTPVDEDKALEISKHQAATRVRALPHYIMTYCTQRDYLDETEDIEIWKVRHPENPNYVFKNLNTAQRAKVKSLFDAIRTGPLAQFVTLWDSDLSFVGKGGEACGCYGQKGLSEFHYIMETIAIRMTPDRTQVKRPPHHEYVPVQTLTSDALINGNVAFVRVLE